MVQYGPKKVPHEAKGSLIFQGFTKRSKMVQMFLNCLNILKTKFSKWFKMVKFVKTVYYGPILSKTVQHSPKRFKWSASFSKWTNKVKIYLKLFPKITVVGVKAVRVTAVRKTINSKHS